MYHDQKAIIDSMTDEDAGKLIKAIFEYAEGNEPILSWMRNWMSTS